MIKAPYPKICTSSKSSFRAMHNVLFVQYVFRPTEQAETNLKFFILQYYLLYICPSLFSWKENMNFEETVSFKLKIWDFWVILTDFEGSKSRKKKNIGKIASKILFSHEKVLFCLQSKYQRAIVLYKQHIVQCNLEKYPFFLKGIQHHHMTNSLFADLPVPIVF